MLPLVMRLLSKLDKFRDRGSPYESIAGSQDHLLSEAQVGWFDLRRARGWGLRMGMWGCVRVIIHLRDPQHLIFALCKLIGGSIPECHFPTNCWPACASCHLHLDGLCPFKPCFWETVLRSGSEKGAGLEERGGGRTQVVSSLANQGGGPLPRFNSWNRPGGG